MSGGHTVHKYISAAFWKVINGTKDYFAHFGAVGHLSKVCTSYKYA